MGSRKMSSTRAMHSFVARVGKPGLFQQVGVQEVRRRMVKMVKMVAVVGREVSFILSLV